MRDNTAHRSGLVCETRRQAYVEETQGDENEAEVWESVDHESECADDRQGVREQIIDEHGKSVVEHLNI